MQRCLPLLALLTPLPAQDVTLQVVTQAGPADRRHTPTVTDFVWPEPLAARLAELNRNAPVLWQARLRDGGGQTVPCEVLVFPASEETPARAELRTFVNLPANGELRQQLVLGNGPTDPTGPFTITRATDRLELRREEHHVLRVDTAYDPIDRARTGKPIWHLFMPDGKTLLTKGEGGEYPHHRGVFAGWNQTKIGDHTYDFWHCRDVAQRHAGFDDHRCVLSAVRGAVGSAAHWLDPVSEPVVRDRRNLTCWLPSGELQLFDLEVVLSADRPVELGGDPQHAGCQIRLANEVAERKDARYLRPESATGGKNDVWSNCPWVVASSRIGGQEVHVMHMNHGANPAGAVYSTRDYGRFGVWFKASIAAGQSLSLRIRVAVSSAPIDAARAGGLFTDYSTPPLVRIE